MLSLGYKKMKQITGNRDRVTQQAKHLPVMCIEDTGLSIMTGDEWKVKLTESKVLGILSFRFPLCR